MTISTLFAETRLPEGAERRRYPRYAVRIDAKLTAGGSSQAVVLNDLSAGGAGLTGVAGLALEQPLTLEFRCGRQLTGHVGWHMAGTCGVRFDEPLDLDDVLLRDAAAASGR